MSIYLSKELPARKKLASEGLLFSENKLRSSGKTLPLNILILNLMPEKEKTEVHLIRMLGKTELPINITLMKTDSYQSKTTSSIHLDKFYQSFQQIKSEKWDGLIVTGAPVELMDFEHVAYWNELKEIMDWSKSSVKSTLHICWGAQAALYHHYKIGKFTLPEKCSGVFSHSIVDKQALLVKGFQDNFLAPHSRHTDIAIQEIENHPDLKLVAVSEEAGAFIIESIDLKHIMVTGHFEYDASTLEEEYKRDVSKGIEISLPKNYFPDNNPNHIPLNVWKNSAEHFFYNWLVFYLSKPFF